MRIVAIVIVTIIVIYIVSFFQKLEHVDRSAMIHSIGDKDSLKLLMFPFKHRNYIAEITNGRIYMNCLKNNLKNKIENKMFWIYMLSKYEIPHETLIAHCEESHCIEHVPLVDNEDYIEYVNNKARHLKGNQVNLIEGVPKVWTQNKCKQKSIFHVVTLYTQEIFCVWDTASNVGMRKLMSNLSNKMESECFTNCNIQDNIEDKRLLFELSTKLIKLHFKEFSSLFSISWQVQVCDRNAIVVMANVDPFTNDMSRNEELVTKYKKKLSEFLTR